MFIMPRSLAAVLAILLVAACADQDPTPLTAPEAGAPLLSASPSARTVPDRYIVVLKAGADAPGLAERTARAHTGTVHYVYQHALNGFAATLPPQALEALRHNPQVDFIEADQVMSRDASQSPATWGLDRIDQRSRPTNNTYNYYFTGAGVHVYVIDTGVRSDHVEYSGRLGNGWSYIADGNGTEDCGQGHGTLAAGIVGGTTYGVAKGVTIHPVRVFDCSWNELNSSVIAGVNGVTANAVKPAVANMSLSGGTSTALDNAVRTSIGTGITYVVSGGNIDGASACTRSPARVAEAITVGATTSSDARASFSATGSCLDIFAPGTSITSAGNGYSTHVVAASGVSFAVPHVSGAAALYLQSNPTATPAQVQSEIIANATLNKVTNAGTGSPNRLLFSMRRLTATISGPSYIGTEGTYGWTVTASGGEIPGSYSYSWDLREEYNATQYRYNGVSSTSSYSRYVGPSYWDFSVFANVTSGTETVTPSMWVNADIVCTNEPCPY
jgi:subtilisin family serine protease